MALAIQSTFFDEIFTDWKPPTEFPRLADSGGIAIDVETKDKLFDTHGPGWFHRDGGFITGVVVATADWEEYYPTRHASGNLNEDQVFNWLRDELKNPNLKVNMWNSQYDRGWLSHPNYRVKIAGPVFDGLVATPLLDENRFSYELDRVSVDYLGTGKGGAGKYSKLGDLKDVKNLLRIPNPKKIMDQLPSTLVAPYGKKDGRTTHDTCEFLKKKISEENLGQIFDLESRLQPVLLEMRRRGVPVDVEKAELLSRELKQKVEALLLEIHDLTGHWIEPMNADQIAKMLDSLGIHYSRTAKTDAPSITKGFLHDLKHPVGDLILRARKYSTAEGTFIRGCVLNHQIDGRVHAEFHPLRKDDERGYGGAVTGRFSSSNPSLQNLPALDPDNPLKDEIGLMVRSLFLPWTGELWAAPDYSGQEPRLITHFASLTAQGPDRHKVKGVELFVEAYRKDAAMKFHKKGAEICGLGYKAAKNMTLGIMYGMGGAKMCRGLGLPTVFKEMRDGSIKEVAGPEGQKVFDRYSEFMPWVRGMAEIAAKRAEVRGYIRTLLGRLRHFAPIHKGGAFAYKALNCLAQGSAADQMKQAMVDLFEQLGVVPLVTVHDELGLSVPNLEEAKRQQQVMLDCVTLEVPNAMDLEIGRSWGEAKAA